MLKLLILQLVLGASVGANNTPIVEPLSSSYQVTNDYWSCNLYCNHLGTDMVANANTEVHAICEGRVVEVTYRAESETGKNYGGRVLIECDGTLWNTVTVLYGHFGRDTTNPQTDDIFVSVGDTVTAGQVIGRIGDSNENGGWIPHLHIGVHREAYLGSAFECGAWTYAGYTMGTFNPADSCYCGVMDNWIDPMEFLGIYPRNLRILEGTHSPEDGHVNDTEFTWHLSAVGGRGLPISPKVIIKNPLDGNEYPFAMRYIEGTSSPFEYEFTKRLANVGEYFYRFSVETCADKNEEYGYRIGPTTTASAPPCVPVREVCDGIDNDCDSRTDENLTRSCSNTCGNTGTQTCSTGTWGTCSSAACPPPCVPSTEICNGRDEDCDGQTDEDLIQYKHNTCGNWTENCVAGVMILTSGTRREPTPEVCDSIDNDCNSLVDDNIRIACGNEFCPGERLCVSGSLGQCTARATTVEICDNQDNDCDGQVDEGVKNACGQCGQVPTEVCDSRDNDCDGLTDESLTQSCNSACGNGQKVCSAGTWGACNAPSPQTEICDGADNDCDGQTDESLTRSCSNTCGGTGTQTCSAGNWGTCNATACPPPPPPPPVCTPTTEVCDGADNDCDNQIDENLTRNCSNTCGGTGTQTCSAGNWGTCTAPACPVCTPSTETCDGIDNDCDGQTDESLTRSCSNECGNTGTQTCSASNWGACSAPACPIPDIPQPEVCDGIDNDMDGQIDEGLTKSCNNACGNTGTQACSSGTWGTCSAPACCVSTTEVCDGADNDCDNQIDENLTRSCSNTCGNTGTQTCSASNWGTCSAAACPPPVPQVISAPGNTAPADNYIGPVNIGAARTIEIHWGTLANAASFSYVMRQGNTGTVLAQGDTTNRYYSFSMPTTLYGTEITWQVRGVNSAGNPGPWSNTHNFFISYPSGSVIMCTDSACPFPGAWYLVSGDILSGTPNRLILDWISAACTAGRSPTTIPFQTMSGYARSSRKNGCP